MALTRAQIQTAFQNSLGRAASSSDENSYFAVSQSGALTDAQVFTTISNSQEANLNTDPVVRFYQAAFGRVPDQAGLDNATDYVRSFGASAATYQNLSDMFATSPEFTNRFGTGTAVDAAYVQSLYSTILGRQASAAEINGYVSGANGYTTRGGVLYAVSQSQEAIGISDAAVNGFLNNAAQGTAVYNGSLYTTQNGQPNIPGQTGTTYALTTGVDALTGTGGNDTFNGVISPAAGIIGSITSTFNTGDSITGGAGADTLSILSSDVTGAVVTPGSISGVEVLRVQNFNSSNSIDLTNATGVQTLSVSSGNAVGAEAASQTTFTNVQNLVGAEINGTSVLEIDYAASVVAGTNDAQSLSVNAADNARFTANGIETLNVTAAGTSVLEVVDANLKTINVSGAGNLTLASTIAGTSTFNGSAATGNLTATFGEGASTVTGGSGNDRFIFNEQLGTGDTVVGGAGTDTIAISSQTLTAGVTLTSLNTTVSGVEVLEFVGEDGATITGGTGTNSFTNAEITKILFNTEGSDVVNLAGSARTYAVGDQNDGNLTLNLSANTTSVKVGLEASTGTDATSANIDTLTVALDPNAVAGSTETVNISSTGTNADGVTNTIGTVTAQAGSVLNITGSHDLAINALTQGGTVNASTFTGKLALVGSGVNDSITVGSGGSEITGGLGADQITFGSGSDTANFASGTTGIGGTASDSGVITTTNSVRSVSLDTITNFTAGSAGDRLNILNDGANTFTALTAAQQTAINNTTTNATLADAIDAASNANATAGWTAFTYSGTTYALHETADNTTGGFTATDTVVKLVGVDVTTLVQANFGAAATANT